MTENIISHNSIVTKQQQSRIFLWTGLLYLIIIGCGVFTELGIRSRWIISGNPIQTFRNVSQQLPMFRFGFMTDMLMILADVAIAWLFYTLFEKVNKPLALVATAFRLTQAAVLGTILMLYFAAIYLVENTADLTLWINEKMLTGGIGLLFEFHSYGYDLGLFFFGLSCILIGYLIHKSTDFPSALGLALTISGVIYFTGSTIRFLWPDLTGAFQPAYLIPLLSELAFCIWLLRQR